MDLIIFVFGNYFVTLFLIGLAVALVRILRAEKPVSKAYIYEALLSDFMLYAIGISNLLNFVFHVFFGDMAAGFIGWDDSPFQAEVGFASLGVGIAGILAYRRGFQFRFAAIIPPVCFSLGAAGGHIYQMIKYDNYSPGNVGLVLPINFILPITGIFFLMMTKKYPLKDNQEETSMRTQIQ